MISSLAELSLSTDVDSISSTRPILNYNLNNNLWPENDLIEIKLESIENNTINEISKNPSFFDDYNYYNSTEIGNNNRVKLEVISSKIPNDLYGNVQNFTNHNVNDASNGAQVDIYRDLILRHLIQDINGTCAKLNLPTGGEYLKLSIWVFKIFVNFYVIFFLKKLLYTSDNII